MQRHGKWSLALRTLCALMIVMSALTQGMSQPFTYQGFLKESGNPANGNYQMTFRLFSVPSGGSALATVGPVNVAVSNGLFTQELNFGNVWDGSDRYLEIQVGSTTLSPRVKINPTPYANTATLLNMFQSGTTNPARMVITHSPVLPNWGLQYQDVGDKFNFLSDGTPVMTVDLGAKKVGIGTNNPLYGDLHVVAAPNQTAIYAYQTGTVRFVSAIYGKSDGASGRGVTGIASDINGIGVLGAVTATAGNPVGVLGIGKNPSSVGVIGSIGSDLDFIPSVGSAGVVGDSLFTTGISYGGWFRVYSPDAHGLIAFNQATTRATEARLATYHDNLLTGETNLSSGGVGLGLIGLYGRSTSGSGTGVAGESEDFKGVGGWTRNGFGVAGHQMGTSGSGIGVWGYAESASGVGVLAQNTQNGPALEIQGQIVVPNAHTATDTPVFKHTATSANTSGHITTIDHPMCNGDPNAMLIVTHDWGTSGPYVTKPFGVWYNGSRWTIFIEDGSAMPIGAKFNVLVIKTSRGGGFLRDSDAPPLTPSAVRTGDER